MRLQILGGGCPKCEKLAERTEAAAKELGVEYTIEKVTDVNEIASLGVMATPSLVADGEPKIVGKVPSVASIKETLAGASS
ncbi:MAG: thioredoxin family protein [Ignavibacteriales bacterium]|nr:thioredoxin family protein [Ignavibacteriales bacterium]